MKKDFNFYILNEQDIWDLKLKTYRKKVLLPENIDKRQYLKDSESVIEEKVKELYDDIKKDKKENDTFIISQDIKIDNSYDGILIHMKGVWVDKLFIDSQLEDIFQKINRESGEHRSYYCPLCGRAMLLNDEIHLNCQTCGVGFNLHHPDNQTRRANENFSITYWH